MKTEIMPIGQWFLSKSKVQERPTLYEYQGRDKDHFDQCCNLRLLNINTSEIIHVEPEWFNQRKIVTGKGYISEHQRLFAS